MKNQFLLSMCVLFICLAPACTLHFPYDWFQDNEGYSVLMKINPDDAEVLLNGRMIGYAYEFSTWPSALRLASRQSELVIKKQGYCEEEINLRKFHTAHFTIRLDLEPIGSGNAVPPVGATAAPKPDAKNQDAYIAKTESVKPVKEIVPAEKESVSPIPVVINITPEDSAIYINGKFWGVAPEKGRIENQKLKPGAYVIEVFKAGYKAQKKEFTVAKEKIEITIKLEK